MLKKYLICSGIIGFDRESDSASSFTSLQGWSLMCCCAIIAIISFVLLYFDINLPISRPPTHSAGYVDPV